MICSADSHTVWIYLAFLPFQLIEQFKWYTIPGVAMAAFIYLGFVAAGEEIEQPFGMLFVIPVVELHLAYSVNMLGYDEVHILMMSSSMPSSYTYSIFSPERPRPRYVLSGSHSRRH
jgi:hypothetical protein